ncbi:MAG TPA: carotenoid biosynthesis protein [Acidimicrobiales bacterium]|nr:carotenoid biosynthesis protein [Acidimicrobiales bacterium]
MSVAVARHPAWVPFAVMALAQIAIPLVDHDPTLEWLSSLVVVAFAATTLVLAVDAWGAARSGAAAVVVVVATLAVEKLGTTTGVPFGEYDYTGALQPTVAGVPLIVPLAWFAMGVPALEVGHAIRFPGRLGAVLVGAVALTAWDLFLDPQMVDAGYWEWAVDGRYHGIPLSNYAGWLVTGVVVLAVVERIRPAVPPSAPLLWLYTWWAVMSTVGFVVFFGEPAVGLVGGVAMGTVAALAWRARG